MRVVGTASLLILAVGAACAEPLPPTPERAPDVLLITIDTLRADRLGAYGHPEDISPHLDALARRGVRFADVTVQWPKTWPSIASLLTGAYPRTTGIGVVPRRLPDSLLLMSEVFAEKGYATAAVVANFNVGRTTRFDQGFHHFVESWQEKWQEEAGGAAFVNAPGRVKEYTNATLVTDQALRWLRARDTRRPVFLWLHYMDPHGPYQPPAGYEEKIRGRYPSAEIPLERLPPYQRQYQGGRLVTDLAFYNTRYDRAVRYLDDELGRLFGELGTLGLADSLIVFTADHGESMGEHDYYLEHGLLPYQPTARVPLIVAQPGRIAGGRVVHAPVGLIDLAATLVELAGLPIPGTYQGVSLARAVRGEADAPVPEFVFMEAGPHPHETQLAVRQGRWKLVHVRSRRDRALMTGSEYELYDLERDPGELTNRAAEQPELVARLRGALERWYAGADRATRPGDELRVETLDPRSREMLEALGYLEGGQ
jgi:arylsulfatase A-like enzyme